MTSGQFTYLTQLGYNGSMDDKLVAYYADLIRGIGNVSTNPRTLGAVGDGSTDDYTAVAAAITATPVGGTLDLGGGSYYVGTTPNITKRMTIRNGILIATGRRALVVNSADVTVRDVWFKRTGSTDADDRSCVFVNGARFRSLNCDYINSYGTCLRFSAGTCNYSIVDGGLFQPSAAYRDVAAVYGSAGASQNIGITIKNTRVECGGNPLGIGIFNPVSCSYINNSVTGPARAPMVTLTTWTLVSGTTWKTPDRPIGDGQTRTLFVDGVEKTEDGANQPGGVATDSPSAGRWAIGLTSAQPWFVYLNWPTDPNLNTITSGIVGGYGLLFYNTVGMPPTTDNLMKDNHVSECDGFGEYFQLGLDQNGSTNNRSIGNTLRNVCKVGSQSVSLLFSGIAFSAGTESVIDGDSIYNCGTLALPVPGIRVGPNTTTNVHDIVIRNAKIEFAQFGVTMGPGHVTCENVRVTDSYNSGFNWTASTIVSGNIADLEFINCTSLRSAVHGIFGTTAAGANVRVSVVGGLWADNLSRGIDITNVKDSRVVGAQFRNNTVAALRLSSTCANTVIDDNVFAAGGTGSLINVDSSCTDITIGTNHTPTTGSQVHNIAAPVRILGTKGWGAHWAYTGTPEAVVTASIGAVFHRIDGGAATSIYIKESGTGNTGWVAK